MKNRQRIHALDGLKLLFMPVCVVVLIVYSVIAETCAGKFVSIAKICQKKV